MIYGDGGFPQPSFKMLCTAQVDKQSAVAFSTRSSACDGCLDLLLGIS
jgi:hypothetical protein